MELRRRELAEEALAQSEAEARAAEAQALQHAPKPTPAIKHFHIPDRPLDDDEDGHSTSMGSADDVRRQRQGEGGGGGGHRRPVGRSSGGLTHKFSVSVPRPAKDPYGRKGYDPGSNSNGNDDDDDGPHLEEKDSYYDNNHSSASGSGNRPRRDGWPLVEQAGDQQQRPRAPTPSPYTFDVHVPRHDSSLAPNPSTAPGGYRPDERATLSGAPRFKTHVPSLHGPLSGLPAQRQPTYVPAKAGSKSIAQQLEDMRVERAKKLNKLEVGWNSGYGSVQSDQARKDMLHEFMAQQDQLTDVSSRALLAFFSPFDLYEKPISRSNFFENLHPSCRWYFRTWYCSL